MDPVVNFPQGNHMSNINTVADAILKQNNGQPIVFASATQIQSNLAVGGATVSITLPNPLATVDTGVAFPNRAASGIPFLVRLAGTLQLGRGVGYQIDITQGTGLTPAVMTTGLQTSPLGAGLYNDNFFLESQCMWDPNSLNLRGIMYGWVGATAIAQAAIVASAPAALANLVFSVGILFVNANPSNQVTITAFDAEWL
jgi:hypothetical protein